MVGQPEGSEECGRVQGGVLMEETEVIEEENEEEEERRRRRKEEKKKEKKKQETKEKSYPSTEQTVERGGEERGYNLKNPEKETEKSKKEIKAEPIDIVVPKPLKPLKAVKLDIHIYRETKNEEDQSQEKEEKSEEREVEAQEALSASEKEKETEEINNLMDLLFEDPDGSSISGDISEGDGRPIVIFFDDKKYEEYISALKELLKWEYRIIKGGSPEFKNIDTIKRLLKEADWIRAGGNLVEISLKKEDWPVKEKEKLNELRSRFKELFSQSFGFLLFRHYPDMLRDEDTHKIKMLNIKHKEINEKDVNKILKMIFGFVPVSESGDFSYRFTDARERYEKSLKELTKDTVLKLAVNLGGNESPEHFRIKLFVVNYLKHMLIEQGEINKNIDHDKLRKRIKTEAPLRGEIIADVYLEEKREVFEVETLYATEENNQSWEKKIQRTIEKYEGCYNVDKINIILENLTAMMYIDEIIKLKRIWEKWSKKQNKEVEFYVLNLEENKLVPIDELYQQYLEIQRPVPFE